MLLTYKNEITIIVVNVVIDVHISKSKGEAEMTNKTNKIK